jgi:hypothetical protein
MIVPCFQIPKVAQSQTIAHLSRWYLVIALQFIGSNGKDFFSSAGLPFRRSYYHNRSSQQI